MFLLDVVLLVHQCSHGNGPAIKRISSFITEVERNCVNSESKKDKFGSSKQHPGHVMWAAVSNRITSRDMSPTRSPASGLDLNMVMFHIGIECA